MGHPDTSFSLSTHVQTSRRVFELDKNYLTVSWETLKPVIYAHQRIFLFATKKKKKVYSASEWFTVWSFSSDGFVVWRGPLHKGQDGSRMASWDYHSFLQPHLFHIYLSLPGMSSLPYEYVVILCSPSPPHDPKRHLFYSFAFSVLRCGVRRCPLASLCNLICINPALLKSPFIMIVDLFCFWEA